MNVYIYLPYNGSDERERGRERDPCYTTVFASSTFLCVAASVYDENQFRGL